VRRRLFPAALFFAAMLGRAIAASAQDAPARVEELERKVRELQQRLDALAASGDAELRRQIEEIRRQIDVLTREIEDLKIGEAVAAPSAAAPGAPRGVGPAASKVYARKGVSVGGYGEILYENFDARAQDGSPSPDEDRIDLPRAILYFGYKFDDRWVLNSEIEVEHAVTASDKKGEVAVEFAYLDYAASRRASVRAGLILMPVGLINQQHEPPTFLGARRPDVEQRIIPTTWRQIGLGLYGDTGKLAYQAYFVNGLDSAGFSAEGIGEGSQEGSLARATSWAGTARLDWIGTPGLLVGASVFTGPSDQGRRTPSGESFSAWTTLFDVHADFRWRGVWLRGLYARTTVGDARQIDEANGLAGAESLGRRQSGWYLQAGFDLLSLRAAPSRASLIPFVRYERFDTQASVPEGFERDPANDVRELTIGAVFKPIDPIAIKLDWQRKRNAARTGVNQLNVALGYLF